jgi:dipeptidyl aminopeptidase/acylaminoacyl peptidase
MIVAVHSDKNPGEFYLFDTKTGQAQFLFASKPEIDANLMSPMLPIEFKARDGLTLHGYITIPASSNGKNLPLIINPHGGPHGVRDEWGFDPEVQLFASRGYAVLQVNYRGSGGYGTKFQDVGYTNWGTTMQDDLADGVQWAIKQGYADPNRVCIYGGSYGGYAALENPIRYPDLYKCTVGYAGVYDLTLQGKSGDTHHYASGKRALDVFHADSEDRQKQYSPAYNADKLTIPAFIVYSGHDERVVPKNSEELMAAMDKLGKKYQVMYEPNEMHGYYKPEHRTDLYTRMLVFFDKYIGPDAAKAAAPTTGAKGH